MGIIKHCFVHRNYKEYAEWWSFSYVWDSSVSSSLTLCVPVCEAKPSRCCWSAFFFLFSCYLFFLFLHLSGSLCFWLTLFQFFSFTFLLARRCRGKLCFLPLIWLGVISQFSVLGQPNTSQVREVHGLAQLYFRMLGSSLWPCLIRTEPSYLYQLASSAWSIEE